MNARYGAITLSPPLSMSLSRRSHLDLLRGLRPPLEPRVEGALEGLELRAERVGRRGAIGTRVKRRVLERCDHARDLGFQRRDRGLRLLELALSAAPCARSVLTSSHSAYPPANSVMCRPCRIQIRVVSARNNARSWLTRITVPSYPSIASSSASIDSTSRWFVGSSRMSRLAPDSISIASATRARSPPDSESARRSTSWPENPKRPRCLWI